MVQGICEKIYDKIFLDESSQEVYRRFFENLLSVNPETFQMTLDKIDMIYGSFSNYLTECIGMTPEKRAILCDRYLE